MSKCHEVARLWLLVVAIGAQRRGVWFNPVGPLSTFYEAHGFPFTPSRPTFATALLPSRSVVSSFVRTLASSFRMDLRLFVRMEYIQPRAESCLTWLICQTLRHDLYSGTYDSRHNKSMDPYYEQSTVRIPVCRTNESILLECGSHPGGARETCIIRKSEHLARNRQDL